MLALSVGVMIGSGEEYGAREKVHISFKEKLLCL